MTDRQMKNRLDKIETLQAQVDALKAQIDEATNELKNALGDTEEKVVGNRKIFWKWRAGGTRFDSKRFGQVHPDMVAEFTVEKPATRFWKITEVKA